MKGISKFINKHKKGCIIGFIVFIAIILIFFTIFFIIPAFGNNTYGDRLDGIEEHQISNSTVKEIEESLQNEDGVINVAYREEGRILNFTIMVENDLNLDTAKGYTKLITDSISKKNQKYYDIQVFFNTKEDSDVYPIAGYKHKTSDEFSWGNAGVNRE